MHPLMPFLTEDLWQRTPRPASRKKSIAFGPYPTAKDGVADTSALAQMELFKDVVSAARTIRSEHEINPRAEVPLTLRTDDAAARAIIEARKDAIAVLAKAAITIDKTGGSREPGTTTSVVGAIEVHVGLKGHVTKTKELLRIDREVKRIDKDLAAIEKKMSSKGFVERAPKEVIDETNALKAQLTQGRIRLEESRALAAELDDSAVE
jgi:valyl-tRNA synthetase